MLRYWFYFVAIEHILILRLRLPEQSIQASKLWVIWLCSFDTQERMDKKDIKPFRMGVFARSGGGKSMMTFAYALDLLKGGFVDTNRVVLISRTWKSDPSQSEFVTYCKKKVEHWIDNNAFEELKDAIELLMGIF
jgi:hypothetical protein